MRNQKTCSFPAVMSRIFAAIFLLLFLVSGTLVVYQVVTGIESRKNSRELTNDYLKEPDLEQDGGSEIPFAIDFAELKMENPDIAGWLYVPCLDINQPVLYSGDNSFYLYHDFRKEFSFSGSLFLDMYSHPDFSGGNTLIYGHHMDDGSMFGTLWKIPYQEVNMKDLSFWIYTSGEARKYRIFSAFESNLYSEGFKQYEKGSDELCDWALRMKTESFIPSSLDSFRPEDQVVTLSTCGRTSFERILVMGRMEECISLDASDRSATKEFDPLSSSTAYTESLPYQEILHDKKLYFILAAFILFVLLLTGCLLRNKKTKTGGHKRESE